MFRASYNLVDDPEDYRAKNSEGFLSEFDKCCYKKPSKRSRLPREGGKSAGSRE
jgi:hypothetical protein